MILNTLLKRAIISEEDMEIYQFGLECIVLKCINYASYILIAITMDMFTELLLLICTFIPLRKNAGGFHAKTRKGCYLISCFMVVISLFICNIEISKNTWFMLLMIANIIIILLAPIDNENRKMDITEKRYFRKRTLIYLGIINAICILSITYQTNMKYQCFFVGVMLSAVLLVLGRIGKSLK